MILDHNFGFTGGTVSPGNSDGLTDSPTTGSQVSSQIIDLHMAGIPVLASGQGARDMGIGDDPALKLLVEVTVAFTVGTSLAVALQGAADNGSGAPGSFTTWYTTAVIAEASLVLGARLLDIDLPRPILGQAFPRFFQLAYTTVGTHSTGKLSGFFVLDRVDQPFQGTVDSVLGGYPAGITIAN